MTEYKFDADRFCRVRARSARAMRNFDDEANFLGVADRVRQLEYEVEVWKNKPAMNVQRKYDALAEAVKDERFAEAQLSECWTSERERALKSARAEVDRLIGGE